MPQISTNTTNKYDIHDRIYRFVVRIVNLTKQVKPTPQNYPIINQLVRSVTSMGANDREADGSLTKKDFIHNYVIVRKEGKETVYWLEVLRDTNLDLASRMEEVIKEGKEIVAVVSSIIKKTNVK